MLRVSRAASSFGIIGVFLDQIGELGEELASCSPRAFEAPKILECVWVHGLSESTAALTPFSELMGVKVMSLFAACDDVVVRSWVPV